MVDPLYLRHIKRLTNRNFTLVDTADDINQAINAQEDIIIFANNAARYYKVLAHVFYREPTPEFYKTLVDNYEFSDCRSEIGLEIISRNSVDAEIIADIEKLELTKPWIYLTSDYSFEHPRSIYYPIWFVNSCLETVEHNIQFDIISPRTKLVSYLMFRPWWDRLVALAAISQQSWFDQCAYNFPDTTRLIANITEKLFIQANNFYLSAEEKQIINNFSTCVYDTNDTISDLYQLGLLTNRAFRDSSVNLFGESGYPYPNLTEKSVIPFLSGQLPMIWGGAGLNQHIESLGFDTFADTIPDVNNQNLNLRQQIAVFVECLNNLSDSIHDVWFSTHKRRLHNYQWARSDDLIKKLERPLREWLNE